MVERDPLRRFLLIGDTRCADFYLALRFLEQHGQLVIARSGAGAAEAWRWAEQPDWIVLAQSRRGQFAPAHVDSLRKGFPATPITALCGAWCEGEARSGAPLKNVLRMHWLEFQAEMRELLEADLRPPGDESDAQRLERRLACCEPGPAGVAAIRACDVDDYSALADVAQTFGLAATWWRGEPLFHRPLSALIWDSPMGCAQDLETFGRLAAQHPEARKILVSGFPRVELLRAAFQAGLHGVVRKPFVMADWLPMLQPAPPNSLEALPSDRQQKAA